MKFMGKTGAKAISWDENSYRPSVMKLLRYAKKLDEGILFEKWIAEHGQGVELSDVFMSALKHAFHNAYRSGIEALEAEKKSKVVSLQPKEPEPVKAKAVPAKVLAAEKLVSEPSPIVAKVALIAQLAVISFRLSDLMSDGKTRGQWTPRELMRNSAAETALFNKLPESDWDTPVEELMNAETYSAELKKALQPV